MWSRCGLLRPCEFFLVSFESLLMLGFVAPRQFELFAGGLARLPTCLVYHIRYSQEARFSWALVESNNRGIDSRLAYDYRYCVTEM